MSEKIQALKSTVEKLKKVHEEVMELSKQLDSKKAEYKAIVSAEVGVDMNKPIEFYEIIEGITARVE